jgi:hypothetical protein
MKNSVLSLISIVGLLFSSSLSATLVVDFTLTASTQQPPAPRDLEADGLSEWTFQDSSPLFNGAAAGSNTRIYGAFRATWSTEAVYRPPLTLLNNGRLYMANSGGAPGSADTTLEGIFFWKKANFINDGSSRTVRFRPGESLSITWSQVTATALDMRFVIQQAGNFYISRANFTSPVPNNDYAEFTIDPTRSSWALFNPTDYSMGDFRNVEFVNVEAVGIYFNASRRLDQTIISFNDFQARASLIP